MCVCSVVSSCLTVYNPMDCSPPGALSVRFPRQEYWSVLPCPPPEDLHTPGIKRTSLISPALAGEFFTNSNTWEVLLGIIANCISWRECCENPQFITSWPKVQVTTSDFQVVSEVRSIFGGTEPLAYGVCANSGLLVPKLN